MKKYVTLGEVCTKGSSSIAQKDIEQNNGSYGIYGASGYIKDVDFYHQDKPYIAVVKDGAGIGRTMLLPEKTSVIGTMQYLIPKDNVCVEYLYYAVTYMNLAKYFSGATIPHIYFKDYQKEKLPLLTIEEQRKIADNLRQIDRLIELCNGILQKLGVLVKSRFVEMFGDLIENDRQWENHLLCNIADIVSGITKGRKVKETELIEVPYMAVSNVKDGYIDWTTVKTILATVSEIEQYRIQPEDILMTEGGDPDKLGRGAIIHQVPENCIHQNHIFRVRLDEAIILPLYFSEYLQEQKAKRYFFSCAKQTTGIASINMKQLKALPVLVPPLALQEQFAAFVEQTDKSKLAVKRVLEKAETLKKALMQEYFG